MFGYFNIDFPVHIEHSFSFSNVSGNCNTVPELIHTFVPSDKINEDRRPFGTLNTFRCSSSFSCSKCCFRSIDFISFRATCTLPFLSTEIVELSVTCIFSFDKWSSTSFCSGSTLTSAKTGAQFHIRHFWYCKYKDPKNRTINKQAAAQTANST